MIGLRVNLAAAFTAEEPLPLAAEACATLRPGLSHTLLSRTTQYPSGGKEKDARLLITTA